MIPHSPHPPEASSGHLPLRVVQLITRRQLRGAEVFAGQLSAALARRGHRVRLVGLYQPPAGAFLEVGGVETTDLETSAPDSPRRRSVSPVLVRRTAAFLDAEEPDVVQANGSDTLKYSVLAQRWRRGHRRPALVYRNISMASQWLRGPLHRWVQRALYAGVDHVACLTPATAEDFRHAFGIASERLSVIPIGTPILASAPDREAARCELELLLGESGASSPALTGPLVLHVGSLTPEKDHATLLVAFRRVVAELPGARLVMIGDGPRLGEVEAALATEPLSGRAFRLPARPGVADLLPAADVVVLPSRIEGLPGVLLEAGARGVPMVATRVGSVADVVVDGVTGRLVEPERPQELAAALATLLADPQSQAALGRAARKHVTENYGLESVVDRFEALYRSLSARHRIPGSAHG